MPANAFLLPSLKRSGGFLSVIAAKDGQDGVREPVPLFSRMLSGIGGNTSAAEESKPAPAMSRTMSPEPEIVSQKLTEQPDWLSEATKDSNTDGIVGVRAKDNPGTQPDDASEQDKPVASSEKKKEEPSSLPAGLNVTGIIVPPKAPLVSRLGAHLMEPNLTPDPPVPDSQAQPQSLWDPEPPSKPAGGPSSRSPEDGKTAPHRNEGAPMEFALLSTPHWVPVVPQPIPAEGAMCALALRPEASSSESAWGAPASSSGGDANAQKANWQKPSEFPQSASEPAQTPTGSKRLVPENPPRLWRPAMPVTAEAPIVEPAAAEPPAASDRVSGVTVSALPGTQSTAPLAFALRLLPDLLQKNPPPATPLRPLPQQAAIAKTEPAVQSGSPNDDSPAAQKPASQPAPHMRPPPEPEEETTTRDRVNAESGPADMIPRTISLPAQDAPHLSPSAEKAPRVQPGPPPISQEIRSAPVHNSTPASAHDIQFQVERGVQRVDVRLTDRGGAVHVSVRTPDAELAATLREDLPALSTRLDQSGFHSETLQAPADLSPAHPRTTQSNTAPGSQDFNRNAHSGQSGQQPSPDQRHRPHKPGPELDNSSTKRKEFSWFMSNAR